MAVFAVSRAGGRVNAGGALEDTMKVPMRGVVSLNW